MQIKKLNPQNLIPKDDWTGNGYLDSPVLVLRIGVRQRPARGDARPTVPSYTPSSKEIPRPGFEMSLVTSSPTKSSDGPCGWPLFAHGH
jgi:hypothetical protein